MEAPLRQPSGIWKGRDFTCWSRSEVYERVGNSVILVFKKRPKKTNKCILWQCEKVEKTFWLEFFISYRQYMYSSKLGICATGMWKGYHLNLSLFWRLKTMKIPTGKCDSYTLMLQVNPPLDMIFLKYQCYMQISNRLKFDMIGASLGTRHCHGKLVFPGICQDERTLKNNRLKEWIVYIMDSTLAK